MFCRSVFGNIYVFTSVFVLFIVFDYLNGLKVIHHRANNGVNPRRVVKTSSLWKGGNFFPSSNIDDEDDDLDSNDYTTYSSDQSVERQSRVVLSRSQQQVGAGQHFRRFYDQTAPDSASGSFYPTATKTPPSSLGSSSQRQIRVYLKNLTVYTGDLVRLHCPYAHPEVPGFSNPDHYLSTKTVIWTHELSSPKLLSNDAELFIKSARFRLESAEPFIASSSNEHISNKFESKNSHNSNDLALLSSSMKKHFILAICPSRVHDSGWYSCTVVKKHLNDPSVKYYTYLNVLAAETEAETSNDDDDASYDDEYEDEYGDFEEICRDKEIVHEATSHFDNDMNKSSTTLSVKETDDMKNISLKRQIDTRANNTSTSTTTNNTPLNTTYLLVLNTSQIEDPLAEYASSIAVASSADNNNTITNNDLTERVSTHPRHLNETEFASFQLNCIYTGPRFADVRLVWLKNEKILSQQVDDSVQQPQQQPPIQQTPAGVAVAQLHPRRYFTLNYKQNYTSIGVLKFSYGLVKDSGVYRCVALHDTDDSVRLALNDTSYLVVNKDAFGTADSLAKYGSSLERDFLINGQNPLVVENFIVYMILAVYLKFFV